MSNDLEQRVQQYRTFELPGQPMATHMGTSYLINDLWKEVERLRAELDALKSQPPAILPEEAFDIGLEAIPYYTAHSF